MTLELGLHFTEETHTYHFNGDVMPSVTEILKPLSELAYKNIPPATMEAARQLGVAVHKVIELDIRGTLDEDSLDDVLRPYLFAWQQFKAQSGFIPLLSEQRVFSLRYRFAGTLDIFGILNGDAALIDAKRVCMVQPVTGPQLAAYEIALRESQPEVVANAVSGPAPGRINRFALQLKPEEKWKLVQFRERTDAHDFLSILNYRNTITKWRKAA